MLSVIIPSYNEEKMIEKCRSEISGILQNAKIDYELIFVDDGSKDKTWDIIEKLSSEDKKVVGIKLSRNFGKESAMFAGLNESKGDCVCVIDCDLQHPPEKMVEMYRLWEQGYEIVEGEKLYRGEESKAHEFAAKTFYSIISNAIGVDMSRASDYKLLDRKAVNVLINIPEKNSFFRAMSSWVGFKTTTVNYEVREREAGESKWSTWKLTKYAMTNVASFTTKPMQIVTVLGLLVLIASIVLSIITIIQKIIGTANNGFSTVIIFIGFTSSIIMISLGIIGYYISKIYEEVKARPRYIISKREN